MKIEVGSYEAKTKLPELLRGVQTGKRYTITLRGEAVADLVPPKGVSARTLPLQQKKCGPLCVRVSLRLAWTSKRSLKRGVHEFCFGRFCRALVAGSSNQPSRRSLCGFGTASA